LMLAADTRSLRVPEHVPGAAGHFAADYAVLHGIKALGV